MRTVVGLFQDKNEALRTAEDLKQIGISESDVGMVSKEGANGPIAAYLDPTKGTAEPEGIMSALSRLGLSHDSAEKYVAGIQAGCTLEAVSVEDARANEALEIMRAHSIGTEERSKIRGAEGAEEILPVIVEELAVGKRQVEAGGVRATTTTQTTPVEKEVELRTESVDVERRKVDRPVQPGESDLFRDREIEVKAVSEEPVVAKTARVVEEVVVKKGVDTRTETVRDTVRRTDVDVQRIPYSPSDYQEHYRSQYGTTGASFDEYEPAYRFGHEMRSSASEETAKDWSAVEPEARTSWEEHHPNTWERFKEAIRRAWER